MLNSRIIFLNLGFFLFFIVSCTAPQLRMPSSQFEIYPNDELRTSLKLAASQGIVFHLPAATLQAAESTDLDPKCKSSGLPVWPERLSVYLSLFRKNPELLSKFHVFELKQGDRKGVSLQKDLVDGGMTLSIQFEKVLSKGTFGLNMKLPCAGNRAEYLNRPFDKTFYDFPEVSEVQKYLQSAVEKGVVDRFRYSNDLLMYLAERGVILRFDHDRSLERLTDGRYVLVEVMNTLAAEVKNIKIENHIGLWLKKINQNSDQASLIQLFSLEKDREQKAGVKVDSLGELHRRGSGDKDLTYLFASYRVDNDKIYPVTMAQLSDCLLKFTNEMGPLKFRQPADEKDRESYLYPGFECKY